MVTLLDDPITMTNHSLTMHPYQPFQSSLDLNASTPMISTTCMHPLSSDVILRDHPMMITTTAAASAIDDDEQPHAHSTSSPSDKICPDSLSLFLQEWNSLCNELVPSPTYWLNNPMRTKLFDSNIIADDDINQLSITNADHDTIPAWFSINHGQTVQWVESTASCIQYHCRMHTQ